MARKPTKNDIRQAALDTTRYFVVVISVPDDARVRKYTHQSTTGPIPGWLVTCEVFVPEDHFTEGGGN